MVDFSDGKKRRAGTMCVVLIAASFPLACVDPFGAGEGDLRDIIAPTIRWVHHDGTSVVDEELPVQDQQLLAVYAAGLLTAEVRDGAPTGHLAVVSSVVDAPTVAPIGDGFDPDFWPWVSGSAVSGAFASEEQESLVVHLERSSSIIAVTGDAQSPTLAFRRDDRPGRGTIAAFDTDEDGRGEVLIPGLNGEVSLVGMSPSASLSITDVRPLVEGLGYCLTAITSTQTHLIAAGAVCFATGSHGSLSGPDRLFLLDRDLEVVTSAPTSMENIHALRVVDAEVYVIGNGFVRSSDREGSVRTDVAPSDLSQEPQPYADVDVRAFADLDGDGLREPAIVRDVTPPDTELPTGAIDVRGREDQVIGPFVMDLDEDGRDDLVYGLVNLTSE